MLSTRIMQMISAIDKMGEKEDLHIEVITLILMKLDSYAAQNLIWVSTFSKMIVQNMLVGIKSLV